VSARRLALGLLLLSLGACGGCPLRALTGAFTTSASRDGGCGDRCLKVACDVKSWGSEKRVRNIVLSLTQELPSGAEHTATIDRFVTLEGGASTRVTADFHGVTEAELEGYGCEDAGPGLGGGTGTIPMPVPGKR